ncbi:hypothetical protein BO71DRAFT_34424 [Aspergillus ellipticus CBS 707.79]|uniref:Uncharacterized protein n=1 Tax=Aspergillus ellipticus CBS 707.79 TaxID=1448320 RepID=A0A319D4M8_9EURO|nr:hypothetical protein BO71DRAFT_34424 [Aspergillus ellipticus CBS 707.79]
MQIITSNFTRSLPAHRMAKACQLTLRKRHPRVMQERTNPVALCGGPSATGKWHGDAVTPPPMYKFEFLQPRILTCGTSRPAPLSGVAQGWLVDAVRQPTFLAQVVSGRLVRGSGSQSRSHFLLFPFPVPPLPIPPSSLLAIISLAGRQLRFQRPRLIMHA